MSTPPDNSAPEADEIRQQVVDSLLANAPSDWAEIQLDFRASSTICQAEVSGSVLSGSPLLMPPPDGTTGRLKALRAVMFEPGRGTWFSLHLGVQRGGSPQYRFNYTDDPHWRPPVAPTVFTLDQERFPRDDQYIPDWLRERLAAGAAMERDFQQREAGTGDA
ncbi:hypothetical protein ABT324_32180 [Saccharopolyspora sp. NPDC000359]|uniref:hypothetical protein n=1 Tax=Saccharopolyspora sp. NPDC000359 TaxID=3154251 RepID=UPI003321BEFD